MVLWTCDGNNMHNISAQPTSPYSVGSIALCFPWGRFDVSASSSVDLLTEVISLTDVSNVDRAHRETGVLQIGVKGYGE